MPNIPASHRDLLDAPVAVLATNGADGYPQVSALWFLYDGENIKLSLNNSRQKVKNLTQQQLCTLFIMDPTNPYRTLEIRAQAEIGTDEDYSFADELGKKYGGADLRAHDQPGQSRVVVALKPIKFNTWG